MMISTKNWTYGAEHELVDWDRRRTHEWKLDQRDVTMVNSNGIAVDPKARVYHLGGEVNTEPTDDPHGQGEQLAKFMHEFPEAVVNYRSNLHVHVRVPGLRENLFYLKTVQRYIRDWMPKLFPLIEPIPEPMPHEYASEDAYRGARRRYTRRKISHQKMMSAERVAMQMQARTVNEFLDAEALHVPTGKLHWAIAPRCSVNLRQLRETDTVEFRHFPGTTNPAEVTFASKWCGVFMEMALEGEGDPTLVWQSYKKKPWPKFCVYDHDLELGYQATAVHIVGADAARAEIARRLRR